jgi:hypothetical protein
MRRTALAAGTVAALLAACGREPSESPPAAAAETAPAVSPAPPAAEPTGAPPGFTIRVFREDSDVGVEADVERLDDTGTAHWFADVGSSGIVTRDEPCEPNERFRATPKVPAFLKVEPEGCSITITFHLYGTDATYALVRIADNAANAGDLLVAQANYGLAAERLEYANPEEAQRLNVLAAAAAGRVLGVQTPTTTVNGTQVIAPETVEKLKTYQRQANLPDTGVLDAATREAISKMSHDQVLDHAIETPAPPPADRPVEIRSTVDPGQIQDVTLSPAAAARATAIRGDLQRARDTG